MINFIIVTAAFVTAWFIIGVICLALMTNRRFIKWMTNRYMKSMETIYTVDEF